MKIRDQDRFFILYKVKTMVLKMAITEKQVKTRIKNKVWIYSFMP